MVPEKPIQVVCAAVRKNGVIICGARHFDAIMRDIVKRIGEDFTGWEQGFINQKRDFLTRKEAYKLAQENGQIKDKLLGSVLTSEDLY